MFDDRRMPSENDFRLADRRSRDGGVRPIGDVLAELLERPEGCTTKEAAKATGWKEHTCRARISSTIGKAQKREIKTEKVEGRGRVYRIAA